MKFYEKKKNGQSQLNQILGGKEKNIKLIALLELFPPFPLLKYVTSKESSRSLVIVN